ncbi:MAG TPA: mandelate racemase/muconate lactonizing enzyme family protein [Devosiaceae bacterium]
MKLEKVQGYLCPVSAKTAWIFLEATLDEGVTGFGEATAFGAELAVMSEIAVFASALEDRPLEAIGPALQSLYAQNLPEARRAVIRALEQALFDAMSRSAGLSMAALLGGPYRNRVPAYANINRGISDRSPEGFARQASGILDEEGYRAIKIAPFDGYRWHRTGGREGRELIERGIARVHEVRAAVGPDVEILVDCHGRFDRSSAETVMAELYGADLFWIEEPVDSAVVDAAGQRAVRSAAHRVGIRTAGGETLENLTQATTLLSAGGFDVILPDLRSTGIRTGMAMLELAVATGVSASLHNPVGPVLDAVSRHVAAAMPDFLILERQVRETPLYDNLRGLPVDLADGAADVELSGGNGLAIDREVLLAAAAKPFSPTRSYVGIAGAGPDA